MSVVKKIFALVLSLVIIITGLISPFSVASAKTEYKYDEYTYTVSGSEATIVSYPETATGSIEIPSKLNDYTVTTIGAYAFYGCTLLTEIIIPDTVKSIENYTFAYCTSLVSVDIPSSVTSIGTNAFNNSNKVSIVCEPGSYAEKYAKDKGIPIGTTEKKGTIEFTESEYTCNIGEEIPISGTYTSDSDAYGITFSWSVEGATVSDILSLPASVINTSNKEIIFSVIAKFSVAGTFRVTITASDGAFSTCIINVKKEKEIAIFSTERSLSVRKGEAIDLGFGILQGDKLDKEWRKMAIVVSDPTVISLSDYSKVDYGYSLEIRGKKAGSSNLTISDTELGISTSVVINVYDEFVRTYSYKIESLPKFYPNNKYEKDIETNIYNLNDLYINNYSCTKSGASYNVSFNAYNSKYHTAAVDIFDEYGEWIGCEEIKKYSDISSLWDTGEQTYYLITDAFSGKLLTYEQASFSKETKISFTVPEGGYFTISNNFAESIGCFLFNSLEILYTGVSTVIDSLTADSIKVSEFSNLIVKEIKNNPETRKEIEKIFIKAADKEIRNYTKKILAGDVEDAYASLSGLLENILDSLDISWKHAFKSITGIGESIFEYFSGPAGIALKGVFAISKYGSAMLQAIDLAKSTDKAYITVYSDDSIVINPHGVSVITDGNIDNEAVLQVFKVTTDDSVQVILNADDPMEDYETFNICFVKNDKTVQPNGKVKVSIPIPDGMKGSSCVIYRQEEDGSWQIIDAHIEGNYLVFETTHFSLYAIVGKIANIRINSYPQKTEYMLGDTLKTDGLQLEYNGEIMEEGYLCTPTVFSKAGTETIRVKYGHAETSFNVTVKNATHEHHDEDNDGFCDICDKDLTQHCSCKCHKSGISGFFFQIKLFFWKLFRIESNRYCSCGKAHW